MSHRSLAAVVVRLVAGLLLAWCGPAPSEPVVPRHAIAMHGTPKYASDFAHFDYVRPDAPKGGSLRTAEIGTFDSLNAYIIRGVPARGRRLLFETLLARSFDEPFSLYANIAQSVEMPDDRSWIIFNLNPAARFHDATPITAADVHFSWEILKTKGRPHTRTYYTNVETAEILDAHRIRFTFGDEGNWEMPLIIGLMPVFSKGYYSEIPFDRTTLEPPLGSGPYTIAAVDPGHSITYARVKDHWAAALPVNVGRHNFDTIRFDYYRDGNVALEAFMVGEYDFRFEHDALRWASRYDHPAVADGRIRREAIPHQRPVGMRAVALNTRRRIFSDRLVRQAVGMVFDFEWSNRMLYHGAYVRTASYFENSSLAASGPPAPAELALLEPHRARLPEAVFGPPWRPPVTDGSGRMRANVRAALALLANAGWLIRDGRLVNDATGKALEFEILLAKPWLERVLLPWVRNLERLGIKARVRTVDSAQYENRIAQFDFDAMVFRWGQSLSPGNEQTIYWSSQAAETEGSRNYAGIRDPVVDMLIARIADAHERDELIAATRSLDRVLLWGHYVVPLFHPTEDRVAYWDRYDRPQVTPIYGITIDLWWYDREKAKTLP